MAHVFESKWRSPDVRLQDYVDFSALLLRKDVLEGLRKAGFKKPSPVQLEAIPMGRFGKDLLVQAKSGTGKTLVFVIVALELLNRELFRPQVLIVVPTREIATQICSVVQSIADYHRLACNAFIGGMPLFEDKENAFLTQICVGTPGRLRQLIELHSLPTQSIRLLVFDEADQLLHFDTFKEDIEAIFKSMPVSKQVIATSATFRMRESLHKYLSNPHIVCLNDKDITLFGMTHYALIVTHCPMPIILYKRKVEVFEKIIKTVSFAQCLVYCNGVQRVELLYKDIKRMGFSVAYISSAKEQCDRLKAIERLKHFKCKVLVSSDVTARGIDAENVDLIINFDLAPVSEVYIHRVGRAGRFGSIGLAISIISHVELTALKKIEKDGSFKTFILPDPIPTNLILYPSETSFVINDEEVNEDTELSQIQTTDKNMQNEYGNNESTQLTNYKEADFPTECDQKEPVSDETPGISSVFHKETKEEEKISSKDHRNADSVSEEMSTRQLTENSESESRDVFLEEPNFKSTPQHSDKISQETVKMVRDKASRPLFRNMLDEIFEELPEDSDSSEDVSDGSKQKSSIHSASDSLSSGGESSSSSSDSEEDSDSDCSSSDSESDSSQSSTTTSESGDERGRSIYHHNYSRTGRQNPSLISQSVSDYCDDRMHHRRGSQKCKCISCDTAMPQQCRIGSRKRHRRHDCQREHSAYSCSRHPCFPGRNFHSANRGRGNVPQSHFPQRHPDCHRARISSRNEILENYQDGSNRPAHHGRNSHSANRGRGNVCQSHFPQMHSDCHRARISSRNEILEDYQNGSNCPADRGRNFHSANRGRGNVPQSHFPQRRSDSHRARISSRNEILENYQNGSNCPADQSSSRHVHTLRCYLPTEHRCHPNTPYYPCAHGDLCEMWYNIWYSQWLHIQNVVNGNC